MKKIVLFGELLLRLKPEGKERFLQNSMMETTFGGSEANVAVSLSILGKKVKYVTGLPENSIGKAAERSLNYFGVETSTVFKDGRIGIYFLETGACQRPSQVIYDRTGSVVSLLGKNEYDWNEIFSDAEWFHVSGVTPAISEKAGETVLFAMEEAQKRGIKVSLDLNYRKKLWKYGKSAEEVMKVLASKADVIIANEEDIQKCLGIKLKNLNTVTESYRELCAEVKAQYKNASYVAVTLRHSYSADRNGWSAVLLGKNGFYESANYDIENIVERVGAGDSFSAGLIYGLTEFSGEENGEQKALDFAASAGCLKHSIPGDFNLSTKEEILSLMKGNINGRIQR